MDRLEISPSSLNSCAEALESAAKEIRAELTHLNTALARSQHQWRGEAHDAFDLALIHALDNLALQTRQLTDIAAKAKNASEGYGSIDRIAARALGGQ